MLHLPESYSCYTCQQITVATYQQVTHATLTSKLQMLHLPANYRCYTQHVTTAKLNNTLQLLHLPAHHKCYTYQHVTTAKLNSTLQLLHLPAHYIWYRASCDHMGPHWEPHCAPLSSVWVCSSQTPSHGSAVDSPGVADWFRLAVRNINRTLLSVIKSDRITISE